MSLSTPSLRTDLNALSRVVKESSPKFKATKIALADALATRNAVVSALRSEDHTYLRFSAEAIERTITEFGSRIVWIIPLMESIHTQVSEIVGEVDTPPFPIADIKELAVKTNVGRLIAQKEDELRFVGSPGLDSEDYLNIPPKVLYYLSLVSRYPGIWRNAQEVCKDLSVHSFDKQTFIGGSVMRRALKVLDGEIDVLFDRTSIRPVRYNVGLAS